MTVMKEVTIEQKYLKSVVVTLATESKMSKSLSPNWLLRSLPYDIVAVFGLRQSITAARRLDIDSSMWWC